MEGTANSRRHFLRYLAASPLVSLALPAFAQQRISTEVLKPTDALNVFELEAVAKRTLPPAHWGYLSGGVLDDRTLQFNRQAFDAWGLRARRLVDVSRVDLSISLFGKTLPSPVLLSPVSSQHAFHAEGEIAVVRAAGKRKALQILSALTTASLEEVMAAHGGEVWQQIYQPLIVSFIAVGLGKEAGGLMAGVFRLHALSQDQNCAATSPSAASTA